MRGLEIVISNDCPQPGRARRVKITRRCKLLEVVGYHPATGENPLYGVPLSPGGSDDKGADKRRRAIRAPVAPAC